MKHILQKLLLFAYLSLLTINYSCETEKEYVEPNQHLNFKTRKESFSILQQDDSFRKCYLEFKNERQNALAKSSEIENLYNFQISINVPINIVEIGNIMP